MMNRHKIQSFSEDRKVLRSRINSLKIKERNASKNKYMSRETQCFIQKICYRKTASIDMTRHGFINDSKVDPVNYVMKPLRAQLEKTCVKPAAMAVKHDVRYHYSSDLPRDKLREAVTSIEQRPRGVPKSVKHVVVKRHYSPVLPRTKPREAVVTSTERKLPYIPKSDKHVVVKRHYSPVLLRTKPRVAVTSAERKPPCIPKSALSCPGTRSSRNRCRVRIQSEPNPGPEAGQKKVKLVAPNKNKGKIWKK